jgi:hypothetical protein
MNTTTEPVNVRARSSKRRPSISTLAALLVGALLPVLVALVLLGSVLAQRPLFGRLVKRWPALARAVAAEGHGVVTRMTAVWVIGLLVIGGLQGAAELFGLSITDPVGFVVRTLGSLALEAVLYLASNAYLRRRASVSKTSSPLEQRPTPPRE